MAISYPTSITVKVTTKQKEFFEANGGSELVRNLLDSVMPKESKKEEIDNSLVKKMVEEALSTMLPNFIGQQKAQLPEETVAIEEKTIVEEVVKEEEHSEINTVRKDKMSGILL